MKLLLLIAIVLYVLSPVDLIPDYLGPVGRIDEVALLILAWYHLLHKRSAGPEEHDTREQAANSDSGKTRQQASAATSPFAILEVPETATREEIEKAYRKLVSQYHPDKVEHLGPELQAVAHEKMVAITTAYQKLTARS